MRSKFFEFIDFKGGVITYDSFDIDPSVPLSQQELSLQEDMLQVHYGSYVIDVGWYPALDTSGRFVIYLVQNSDWDNPIQKIETNSFVMLKERLQETIDYTEALLSHAHA